jgi:hypothetical protein
MADMIHLTRAELVAVHREWEVRRRLRPSTFEDPSENLDRDVDESAENSAAFVLELLEEIRAKATTHMVALRRTGDGTVVRVEDAVEFTPSPAAVRRRQWQDARQIAFDDARRLLGPEGTSLSMADQARVEVVLDALRAIERVIGSIT